MVGRTVSHYELTDKIGEGGMGVVYKARDARLGRQVALKILPPDRVADLDRRQRFMREARAASALNHPNIITIYDIGSADGVHFIAMEYVGGETLDRLIGRKGLPPMRAVGYAVQMADALEKAHGAGIVHRDLKPSNIMVTPDGLVKILDFGLAKLLQRPESVDDLPTRATEQLLTAEGQIVGTLAYMSPEQATGDRLDGRSDIFSFGAVLYEMLTGSRPFERETGASTLEAVIAREPAAPSTLVEGLPFELERAVLHCLRKDPQRRWQTMADLRVALQDVKDEIDSGQVRQVTSVASRPRRRWTVAGAAAAVLAAALTVGWWLLGRGPSPGATFEMGRLTFENGAIAWPAISADGKLIAYAAEQDGVYRLFVRQIGSRESIPRTAHATNDSCPAFSPDGVRIAYRSERDGGGLYLIDALGPRGGIETKLADGGNAPSFSPDGSTIAYVVVDAIGSAARMFLLPADGTGAPQPYQPRFVAHRPGIYPPTPIWSPDGTHILFRGKLAEKPGPVGWWIAPVSGGEAEALQGVPPTPFGQVRIPVGWRGDFVYYIEGDPVSGSPLYRFRVARAPWRVVGAPEKLGSPAGFVLGASLSAQGRLVFASLTWTTKVWSAALSADRVRFARPEALTADSSAKRQLTASADGSRLAYASHWAPAGSAGTNVNLRLRDVAAAVESSIAGSGKTPFLFPALSRDGSKLGYVDVRGEKEAGYLAEPGAGNGRVFCEACVIAGFFESTPAALVRTGSRLSRRPLDGGPEVAVAEIPGLADVALSPDERRIAFTKPEDNGAAGLYVAEIGPGPAPPARWKLVARDHNLIGSPSWSDDGKVLYYVSRRDGFACVWAQAIGSGGEPGAAVDALHVHPGGIAAQTGSNIAVARDRLFFLATEARGDIWSLSVGR